MLNKVIISGRLTKDPELRHTPNDIPVVSFSIANEDSRKKTDGSREVDFFDVVAWRGLANTVSTYCTKGRYVEVVGKLKNRDWKDRDGNSRRKTEIHADEVYFIGENGQRTNATEQTEYSNNYSDADFEELSGDDAELPF